MSKKTKKFDEPPVLPLPPPKSIVRKFFFEGGARKAHSGKFVDERTAMLLSWAIGMAKMEAVLVESAASQQQAHTLGASAYAMETISRYYVPQGKGKKRERT